MTNKDDVIIFDEEYAYAEQEIIAYCGALTKFIDQYSKCVNAILDNAIRDEEISARLQDLIINVESIKPEIEEIGKEAASACKNYINEIDAADQFLY